MQSGLDYASRKSLFGTPSHSPLWQFGNFSSPPVSGNNCPFSFPTTLQTGLKPMARCLAQDPAQEKTPSLSCLEKKQRSFRLPTNIFICLSQARRKTLLPSTWLLPSLFLLNATYVPFKPLQTTFCPLNSDHFPGFRKVQPMDARHCTRPQGYKGSIPTSSRSVRRSGPQRAWHHHI